MQEWEARYRQSPPPEQPPHPLLVRLTSGLTPGTALDLACGAGRNSIWLTHQGWQVTAVDSSASALELLCARSSGVTTIQADLENGEFALGVEAWDLIVMCLYMQRELYPQIRAALRPGGRALLTAHVAEPGAEPGRFELRPGELRTYFPSGEILHFAEGDPIDHCQKRRTAELMLRKTER